MFGSFSRATAAAAIALSVLSATGTARAQFLEGDDLAEICLSSQDACNFYVAGVIDTLKGGGETLCYPNGTTVLTLGSVVSDYLRSHKEIAVKKYTGDFIVSHAIEVTFPCR